MVEAEETGLLERKRNSTVSKPLKKIMKIDILVNEKSQVWFCYDRPLPDLVLWIEYDLDVGSLTFVMRGGKVADYGELILPEVRTYLKKADTAFLIYMEDKKIQDIGAVKIVTRQLMH